MQRAFVGRLFHLGRIRRGFSEFLFLPVLIAVLFCIAAVLLARWDNLGGDPGLRRVLSSMIPGSGAAGFVAVVAASLMTISSITFTVLLIAVQQTSTFLGAVVFDQYLRRRSNQVYVGYFVGATAFSFIVLAFAGSGDPPVIGAFASLVLTVGALAALPLLIYSTVDQMRPECVVGSIHDLALRAHEREVLLLTGSRKVRRSAAGAGERLVTAPSGGYVVDIDARALAAVARSVGPDAELVLCCLLGSYLASGETIASIAGAAADDDRFDADTRSAVTLDDTRRIEVDSAYSIDQLQNVAWLGAGAQSPLTASAAIHQMRDLVGHWAATEESTLDSPDEDGEPLPVVYTDGAINRVIEGFGTLLVVSARARQTETAALLVTAFAHALRRLGSDEHRATIVRSLDAALPAVVPHGGAPALVEALAGLVTALEDAGLDTRATRRVRDHLGSRRSGWVQ